MAINKNHEFEELNGVKCAIVEKSISEDRATFLESLLRLNGYTVVTVPATPPKAAAAPKAAEETEPTPPPPPAPTMFTVGVTDVTFNSINAVFGRLLKTQDGRVVTMAYWQQKEAVAQDEVPYFQKKL